MTDWASRRKSIYLGALVLVLSGISFFIFWQYWYQTPTCFDGIKNGNETGIDCGGSCVLVCSNEIIKPIIRWDPRLFEVLPDLWSTIVYVENPNINAEATYVPYRFTIYDQDNKIIEERKGATILPKNKTVGIFEGSIKVEGQNKPKRATFEFDGNIVWKKNETTEQKIKITHSPILRLDSAPKVEAYVKNEGVEEVKNIELVVAIFDGSDNTIAASRTFIENLKKDESTNVFFTWPKPFELGSKVCEKPSNIMLLLDRSGSMASLTKDPPQPLSDSKKAAISFINQLDQKDKVGVASFATGLKDPIESALTSDFDLVEKAVESVSIETSSTQYTNIYEALRVAWQELVSARAEDGFSKILILLTDGVANNPKSSTGSTEVEDIKYAESLAIKEADEAKKDGIVIYTIGLGNNINEAFLKDIASREENYFFAPTALNLETIYKNISSDICQEMPARVEITYKIFGDSL